ncbi:MAG TPA: YicC family protein [Chlamydiales bacterium]|nr:YicC family protein [Chlamydiales bacterium]
MPKSMTGFGKGDTSSSFGQIIIEAQSVNKRYLETNIYLPREFASLELFLKKAVETRVFRGFVTIRMFVVQNQDMTDALPNLQLLKSLKEKWFSYADELNLSKESIDIPFLFQQSKMLACATSTEELNQLKPFVEKALNRALDDMNVMKLKEGDVLVKDIEKRLSMVAENIQWIQKNSSDYPNKYAERLEKRFLERFEVSDDEKEKINKEIVLLTEKIDITEEIVRFDSHLQQMYLILSSKEESVGRKLDFLMQEMNREVNTIASKSQCDQISQKVVLIKAELEKVREQIQNIE